MTTPDAAAKCGTCVFYAADKRECHREPPKLVVLIKGCFWWTKIAKFSGRPGALANDWCGEHAPRPAKGEEEGSAEK